MLARSWKSAAVGFVIRAWMLASPLPDGRKARRQPSGARFGAYAQYLGTCSIVSR